MTAKQAKAALPANPLTVGMTSPAERLRQLREELAGRSDRPPEYLFGAVDSKEEGNNRYVFWLDLMGARNAMKLSLPRAARSVMKIHASALLARERHNALEVHPVMDGVYGVLNDRATLKQCLPSILSSLARVFVDERNPSNRFMVRAGVSFGPLIPGRDLARGADILRKNKVFMDSTAIGMGISHAYEAEQLAPPFGIYIHESARAFAPRGEKSFPFRTNLWRWFEDDETLAEALRLVLIDHFGWLERNSVGALYDAEAMKRHRALADEYFRLYELR